MIDKDQYKVGINCCLCAGKLEIDEASHALKCHHCGSSLKIARDQEIGYYVVCSDLPKREIKFLTDRHLKKSDMSLVSHWIDLKEIYLPYWRVMGTVFSIEKKPVSAVLNFNSQEEANTATEPQTEVKIVKREVTFCANSDFPWSMQSLGIRSKLVKLEPLDDDFQSDNQLLSLTSNDEYARERFINTVKTTTKLSAHARSKLQLGVVSISQMVIYFPIWIGSFKSSSGTKQMQFDPIAKRVISIEDGVFQETSLFQKKKVANKAVEIIPHRCPNCGDDLPDNINSVTYYCKNCRRLWLEKRKKYQQVDLLVPVELNRDEKLFPFWIVNLENLKLDNKAELLKTLDLLEYHGEQFYLPAFAVSNPKKLLRLIKHYNMTNFDFDFKEFPDSYYNFVDVTVDFNNAVNQILPLTIAVAALKGITRINLPLVSEASISSAKLIWLPFVKDRYFWREQITGATIEKAVVSIV